MSDEVVSRRSDFVNVPDWSMSKFLNCCITGAISSSLIFPISLSLYSINSDALDENSRHMNYYSSESKIKLEIKKKRRTQVLCRIKTTFNELNYLTVLS